MTRSLTISTAILGGLWLVANGVVLFYAASLVPLAALLLAFGMLGGGYGVALALLIATNTHDAPAVGVSLPSGRAYGRRQDDEVSVTEELSAVLERAAAGRVGPSRTPDWFSDAKVTVTKDET